MNPPPNCTPPWNIGSPHPKLFLPARRMPKKPSLFFAYEKVLSRAGHYVQMSVAFGTPERAATLATFLLN